VGQEEFDTFLGTSQIFTPLSIDKVTMVSPGWKGGVEWGGLSADPDRGIIYANVNNVFSLGSLAARGNAPPRRGGGAGADEPGAPSGANAAATGKPYVFTGYRYFVDPEGYQANAYPWGTLNAIDMNTGKYLWTVPFGEHTELAEKGVTETGAGSHGGTVLTATGVLFTGGSEYDLKFRAYDSATGKVLWTGELPGPGVATPATYAVNGKQYVVIAASPVRSGATSAANPGIKSGTYVVFALP
jgi:glucose dehydrogenase